MERNDEIMQDLAGGEIALNQEARESVFSFTVESIKGENIPLSNYKGKVILIVNTASKCGFTPQYEGLERLYQKYKSKGLEILAFPCNQFGMQEPGTHSQIAEFCQINYSISFPLFAKIDVFGENAHPLFTFLSAKAPGILGSKKIKWNFTKFLVGTDGLPIRRFASADKPEKISGDIEQLL